MVDPTKSRCQPIVVDHSTIPLANSGSHTLSESISIQPNMADSEPWRTGWLMTDNYVTMKNYFFVTANCQPLLVNVFKRLTTPPTGPWTVNNHDSLITTKPVTLRIPQKLTITNPECYPWRRPQPLAHQWSHLKQPQVGSGLHYIRGLRINWRETAQVSTTNGGIKGVVDSCWCLLVVIVKCDWLTVNILGCSWLWTILCYWLFTTVMECYCMPSIVGLLKPSAAH